MWSCEYAEQFCVLKIHAYYYTKIKVWECRIERVKIRQDFRNYHGSMNYDSIKWRDSDTANAKKMELQMLAEKIQREETVMQIMDINLFK